MNVIRKIPFLTRFFTAVAEDLKVPGDEKMEDSEIMRKEKVEGGTDEQ